MAINDSVNIPGRASAQPPDIHLPLCSWGLCGLLHRMTRSLCAILAVAALGFLLALSSPPLPLQTTVGELAGGSVLVPTGQLLVRGSALHTLDIPGRPVDIALGPDGKTLAVLHDTGVDFVDVARWRLLRRAVIGGTSYLGLAFSADGQAVFTGAVGRRRLEKDQLVRIPLSEKDPVTRIDFPDASLPAGVAVSASQPFVYVCLNKRNVLAQVDLQLQGR